VEQLALTIPEACAAARVGRTVLYMAIASGALPARKRGRRTLVLPADLKEWVEKLPMIKAAADQAGGKIRRREVAL
jgi:excisionase family DNA binding protein